MNSPHLQPPCSSPVYTHMAAPAPVPPPPPAPEASAEEATDGFAAAEAANCTSVHEEEDSERLLASPVARSSSPPPAPPSPPPPPKERKSAINKRLAKELNPCRALLEELEGHDESWPFLLPVNTKQFPTYRKIIRCPMDLSTIKRKLCDGTYKSREEFCSDVRLIFNNCETFNEDDSPVGKAGHGMRTFFEARWGEINGHKPGPQSALSPTH